MGPSNQGKFVYDPGLGQGFSVQRSGFKVQRFRVQSSLFSLRLVGAYALDKPLLGGKYDIQFHRRVAERAEDFFIFTHLPAKQILGHQHS